MKLSRQILFACLAAAGIMAAATSAQAQARLKVERAKSADAASACPPMCFSVEVPLVQRYAPPSGGQSNILVLNAAHSFNVTLSATDQGRTGKTGPGVALPQTDLFGYFSFPAITNNPSIPEVFVKILDARVINGNFWVFYGGLTDLFYTLTVTENATGRVKIYTHAQGSKSGDFDVTAFSGSATFTSNTENEQATAATPNAFVRTAIDISNNTNGTVSAQLQYAYVCTAPTCSPVGEFNRTSTTAPAATIQILGFGSRHFDDIVQYFKDQGLLQPGADQGSTGTFLVFFNNVPSNIGWEGTVQARTYNRVSEVDPLRGTVGFGENGSLFLQSTNTSLVGTAVDTRTAPTLEGSLTTHVGIRNTDISDPPKNVPVTVDLTLYDPATGQRVGNTVPLPNIAAGEVRLVNDLFTVAAVPASVHSVILFADTRNHPVNAPTIEGFVLTQDTNSLDTRFNELQCADPGGRCGF